MAGSWTHHAARVCHSRFARSLRWFHVGGGRLIGKSVHAVRWPYNGCKLFFEGSCRNGQLSNTK